MRYFTATELVETLYRGLADNSVGRVIEQILKADLILIDEIGFAPMDDTGAQLFFRIVAAAYERRSLGIGSHWPFEDWGRFLPEHTTAVSLLDRLLHHSVLVATSGESFRLKEARQKGGGPEAHVESGITARGADFWWPKPRSGNRPRTTFLFDMARSRRECSNPSRGWNHPDLRIAYPSMNG